MRARIDRVVSLLLLELSMFVGIDLFLSGFPVYMLMLGAREDVMGFLFGVFGLSAIVFRPLLARIGQRYGQKWILLLGAVVAITAPWMYFSASSLPLLVLVRVYHGLVPASFITASKLLLIAQCGEEQKSLGVGLFGMAGGLSLLFAPYLGVHLLSAYGPLAWLAVASSLGLLASLIWVYVYQKVDEVLTGIPDAKFNPLSIAIPLICNVLFAIGFGTVMTFVSTYAIAEGSENPGQFFTVLATMTVATRVTFGIYANKLPKRKIMFWAGISYVTGLVLLAFPPTPSWIIIGAVPVGFGLFASLDSLFLYVADSLPLEHRSVATAYIVNGTDVGFAIASMGLGSVVVHWSYQALYLVASFCALAAFIMVMTLLRPIPNSS